MEKEFLLPSIESMLFASVSPVSISELEKVLEDAKRDEIIFAVEELICKYQDPRYGFSLENIGNGYQFRTKAGYANLILKLKNIKPQKLSRAALETLAIIAYKQPVTRGIIEKIRGVDSSGVLKMLMVRSIIKIVGKKDGPGNPLLYGTGEHFLELLGITSLADLPNLNELYKDEKIESKIDSQNPEQEIETNKPEIQATSLE
jgi:segregation and condensation protein B